MSRLLRKLGVTLAGTVTAIAVSAQDVDYTKYPDYVPLEAKSGAMAVPSVTQPSKSTRGATNRPAYVDNSKTPYFPAIFNQAGGSCGSASRIGYMFTHEINSYRRADASLPENVYPTHFTWLLTGQNSGKEEMARDNGIPNSVVYGGKLYSNLFGEQICDNNYYGWMQGYDKWYSAMFNRIETNENFPALGTEEGREMLKNWLWNHCGDEDFGSGGIAGIGVASACTTARIPATANNNANGVTGLEYVTRWGQTVDHALTIVGYDDRIEFDLDGNGVYGEADKDELGAWIIANSWGYWANKGFIYCPYKHARINTNANGVFGSWMGIEVYKVRKNYRPLRTIKLNMDYSKRSEIKLSVGVASDLNATVPETTVAMHHFIYAGAGNGATTDPEMPMLGRWKDGIHSEPMEFGYDLTTISRNFNTRETLKYFLVIETKTTANGTGRVYNCSVLDYEFDEEGIVYHADLPAGGLDIKSGGSKTIIPIMVMGEKVQAPLNLVMEDGKLRWSAPMACAHTVKSYNIYEGDKLIGTVPASQLTYAVSGSASYSVSAMYDMFGGSEESERSNAVSAPAEVSTETNQFLNLTNNTVTIDNLISRHLDEFTVEFMYKPMTSAKTVILSAGDFTITLSATGQLIAGWGVGNQVVSTGTPLSGSKWKHVAVTVKRGLVTCYVDGKQYGTYTSASKEGVDASEQFVIGATGGLASGAIDDLRFWTEACPVDRIKLLGTGQMAQPGLYANLLSYYRMNSSEDNKYVLVDCKGNHPAVIAKTGVLDAYWTTRDLFTTERVVADFTLADAPYLSGAQIKVKNISSPSSTSFVWNAPEAGIVDQFMLEPTLVYEQPGDYTVTLTVVDKKGTEHVVEKNITVVKGEISEVDFELSATEVACGEEVELMNKSALREGYTYEWSMPGAETETVRTFNAKAVYISAGRQPITLTVRNGSEEAKCVKYIEVKEKAPKAGMTVTPTLLMKGGVTNLLDASYYDPVKWTWIVENGNRYYTVDGQHSTLKLDKPGKYNVTLQVANDLGTDAISRKNEIVVYNADSENGLSFDDLDDEVVVENLFNEEKLSAFTIDWWMRARSLQTCLCRFGDTVETFVMKTGSNGQMTVVMNMAMAKSPAGYVVEDEWHHYAVVYDAGKLTFYRDGKEQSTSSVLPPTCPAWAGGFHMGGAVDAINGIVDELRIWKAALSRQQILDFCNAPIEDVAAAQADEKTALELYFPFNQNSGDVQDATSNGYVGKRLNFGPDGDAWSTTTGNTFWIDTEDESVDVTSMYLKNYQAPFLYDEDSYVNGTARFRTLTQETEESPWVIDNSIYTESTNVRTEFFVDDTKNNCLALMTSSGFSTSMKNLKLWQQVTLPAGAYEFAITPYSETEFFTTNSYIVVSEGDGLPDTENISDAVVSGEARLRSVTFVLTEPQTVSLGLLMNMSGLMRTFTLDRFTLYSKPFQAFEADGAVEIDEAVAEKKIVCRAIGGDGVLTMLASTPAKVTVVTTDAKVLYSGVVSGEKVLNLPAGLYIVNNQKVVVR